MRKKRSRSYPTSKAQPYQTVPSENEDTHTLELDNLLQMASANFYDEAGNVLSAITRQASLLKLKKNIDTGITDIADSIIFYSNQLYSSSRNFIWNLNNDSSDPHVFFNYLTSFAQAFCNQYNISFSAESYIADTFSIRLPPFAAINFFFVFKELLDDLVNSAQANKILLKMAQQNNIILFVCVGNDCRKHDKANHSELSKTERCCVKHKFPFRITPVGNNSILTEIWMPARYLPNTKESI